jgi:hypothetical protein
LWLGQATARAGTCYCPAIGGGECFAVHPILIRADANRRRCINGDVCPATNTTSRVVAEYLAVLDDTAFGAAFRVN